MPEQLCATIWSTYLGPRRGLHTWVRPMCVCVCVGMLSGGVQCGAGCGWGERGKMCD